MWRCEICETFNEDTAALCVTCGTKKTVTPPNDTEKLREEREKQESKERLDRERRIREQLETERRETERREAARREEARSRRHPFRKLFIILLAIAELYAVYILLTGKIATEGGYEATSIALGMHAPLAQSTTVGLEEGDVSTPHAMSTPWLNDKTYRSDDMNMDVLWAQTQLRALGYFSGEDSGLTGQMDARTMKAISGFQSRRGLRKHSGQLDQATVNAISIAQAEKGLSPVAVYIGGFYELGPGLMDKITMGCEGYEAQWIQECLNGLGYLQYDVDEYGTYGPKTAAAVRVFQKAYGYAQTGDVTLGLLREIQRAYYESYGALP